MCPVFYSLPGSRDLPFKGPAPGQDGTGERRLLGKDCRGASGGAGSGRHPFQPGCDLSLIHILTASAVLTLGTVFSASAAQWQALGDEWVYVQNDGEYFKDGWKQDGNLYYYLGSDGIMLRRTLIEDDDNYYLSLIHISMDWAGTGSIWAR